MPTHFEICENILKIYQFHFSPLLSLATHWDYWAAYVPAFYPSGKFLTIFLCHFLKLLVCRVFSAHGGAFFAGMSAPLWHALGTLCTGLWYPWRWFHENFAVVLETSAVFIWFASTALPVPTCRTMGFIVTGLWWTCSVTKPYCSISVVGEAKHAMGAMV